MVITSHMTSNIQFQHNYSALKFVVVGRGGGQVVSVLAFYSDDPSPNPVVAYNFFCIKFVFEKNENKQKEAGVGPFKNRR